jgi:hypothetical protein
MIPDRIFEMFWPVISDEPSARAAIRLGAVGAFIAAAWTAAAVTVAMVGDGHLGNFKIPSMAYTHTILLVALGWGVWRSKRVAATLACLHFLSLQFYSPLAPGPWLGAFTPYVLILLSCTALFLFSGVRGTFALKRSPPTQ